MIRLNRRERTLVFGAGAFLALILAYVLLAVPFLGTRSAVEERLEVSRRLLREYHGILAGQASYQEQLGARRAEMTAVDRLLLSGNTSSLAAAELSNKIRAFAESTEVSITRENVHQPLSIDHHQQINIQLNMSCDVIGLRDFLKRVEADPCLLLVQNVEINAPASMRRAYRRGRTARQRGTNDENLRVTMTISGFIESEEATAESKP